MTHRQYRCLAMFDISISYVSYLCLISPMCLIFETLSPLYPWFLAQWVTYTRYFIDIFEVLIVNKSDQTETNVLWISRIKIISSTKGYIRTHCIINLILFYYIFSLHYFCLWNSLFVCFVRLFVLNKPLCYLFLKFSAHWFHWFHRSHWFHCWNKMCKCIDKTDNP